MKRYKYPEDEEQIKREIIKMIGENFCPYNVPFEQRFKVGLEEPVICNMHCSDCIYCIQEWIFEKSGFIEIENV